MPTTQTQLRRGTTAEHATFTGALGEVTVDTTKATAVVHNGSTAGGIPLAREDAQRGLSQVRFYTSSTTWSKPTGLIRVRATVVGGGGNGGTSSSPTYNSAAGGGGGGGTAIKMIAASTLSASESVTVGAATGASSFGPVPAPYLTGGGGTSAGNTSTNNVGVGGAGGTASGGDINIPGSRGGSSAMGQAPGTGQFFVKGGEGGPTPYGNGGGGGASNNTSASPGAAGAGFGAGGGGGAGVPAPGGAGAGGVVIIEEFYGVV